MKIKSREYTCIICCMAAKIRSHEKLLYRYQSFKICNQYKDSNKLPEDILRTVRGQTMPHFVPCGQGHSVQSQHNGELPVNVCRENKMCLWNTAGSNTVAKWGLFFFTKVIARNARILTSRSINQFHSFSKCAKSSCLRWVHACQPNCMWSKSSTVSYLRKAEFQTLTYYLFA